jgi:thiol:disulfide interchange protein DsbA
MRPLRFALLAASLAVTVASTPAFASPTDPKMGVEYVTLAQPQTVQATICT